MDNTITGFELLIYVWFTFSIIGSGLSFIALYKSFKD